MLFILMGVMPWVGYDGVAATADSVDTAALETNHPRGKVGPASKVELRTRSSTASPPKGAVALRPSKAASSMVHASFRERVNVGDESWRVSKTTNEAGSFILLRNTSEEADAAIHVAFGDDRRVLEARQTATWKCSSADGDDSAGTALHVETNKGDAIHQATLRCGDAVYVRRQGATLDGGSLEP